MRTLKSFLLIVNLKAVILVVLSMVSTWLCMKYNFAAELPLTLIGIAVVFPIVFSIGGAYTRREAALKDYANMKAHSRAIYLACRDWMETKSTEENKQLLELAKGMFLNIRTYLSTKQYDKVNIEKNEMAVYKSFSDISAFIQKLRLRGLPSGEASRLNQYLSKMMDAFESSKHIHQYRTPVTLRAYSRLFTFTVPVLYGPFFADLGKDLHIVLVMVTPILFTVILAGLDNIQDQLENPFDQLGEDDIKINAEKIAVSMEIV